MAARDWGNLVEQAYARAVRALLCLLLATGVARAEPVNLLTHRPAIVNVSSAVANDAIKPAHLVDGKLDTAWNSRTGDLVGAWLVVRLPADVQVQSVKLTVGFTRVDPKLGDLFVENPRIKRVRVSHGATVIDKDLDITSRALQEIPIAGNGGDYRIEVVAVEMGSKQHWREICISELEVWGTSAKPMTRSVPDVYVDSFEPPPALTEADCIRLLGAANVSTEVYVLSARYGVCEMVDTVNPQDPYDLMRHKFTAIALPRKHALDRAVDIAAQIHEGLGGQATDTKLRVDTVAVADDTLLLTALDSSTWSNLPDARPAELPGPSTRFTLYRATAAGLTRVLEVEGSQDCTFADATPLPGNGKSRASLDYRCGATTKHFAFDGSRYVRR